MEKNYSNKNLLELKMRFDYDSLLDNMIDSINVSIEEFGLSYEFISDELGISCDSLYEKMINKDFFVCVQVIEFLEKNNFYKNRSEFLDKDLNEKNYLR